jgi:hypothetical protein
MLSQGATIEVGDISGLMTRIGRAREIPFPTPNVDEHEVTNLDSTAKEYEAGLPDNGEIAVPFFVTAEGEGEDEYCEEWVESGETRDVRLTGPTGRVRVFRGFAKTYAGSYQTNTPLERTITIRVSGAVARSWVNS